MCIVVIANRLAVDFALQAQFPPCADVTRTTLKPLRQATCAPLYRQPMRRISIAAAAALMQKIQWRLH
jgi:hypothetical protein